MQLTPGVFSIFYHYALGKKSSKKADDLSLYFVLGAETFVAVMWMAFYVAFYWLLQHVNIGGYEFLPWTIAGIFVAEAVVMAFFYYRKGKMTELFISRKMAKGLAERARNVKKRSDAFVLGFAPGLLELVFLLPVYAVATYKLIDTTVLLKGPMIILAIIVAVVPYLIIRWMYRTDHNLAEIERKRVKMKGAIRVLMVLFYLGLAGLMVYEGLINGC